MKNEVLSYSWVDLLIAGLLVVGVIRGRKRGMSEELLDVIKWVLIAVGAGYAYQPLGDYIAGGSMFSRLGAYISTYLVLILVIIALFAFIRSQIGGKIIGSDVFGSAEYYLGMCAGALRYACIMIVAISLFHAKYYTSEEIKTEIKYQEDLYGSAYFPKPCIVQHQLFTQSLTGRLVEDYLGMLLIKTTAPEDKGLGSASVVRAHERNVYDVLDRR